MIAKTEWTRIEAFLSGWSQGTAFQGRIYVADDSVAYDYLHVPMPALHLVVDLPNGALLLCDSLQEQGLLAKSPCKQGYNGECFLELRGFPEVVMHCEQSRQALPIISSNDPRDLYVPLVKDVERRPYTVCALYRQVGSAAILDPTGQGLSDLQGKVLRALDADLCMDIHPECILQGIELAVSLGLEIESTTWDKMRAYAKGLELTTLLRIREPLSSILVSVDPARGLRLLKELGVLERIIPELSACFSMTQNAYHFGTVWAHTLRVVEQVPPALTLRLAALLHDIGKVLTREVTPEGKVHFLGHEQKGVPIIRDRLLRLQYGRELVDRVCLLTELHMKTKQWGAKAERMKDSSLRALQWACGDEACFEELLQLIDADNRSHAEGYCMPEQVELIRQRAAELVAQGLDLFSYHPPFSKEWLREKLFPLRSVDECLTFLREKACKKPLRSEQEWLYLVEEFIKKEKR